MATSTILTIEEILSNPAYNELVEGYIRDKVEQIKNWSEEKIKKYILEKKITLEKKEETHINTILKSGILNKKEINNLKKEIRISIDKKKNKIKQILKNKTYRELTPLLKEVASDTGTIFKKYRTRVFDIEGKTPVDIIRGVILSLIMLVFIFAINTFVFELSLVYLPSVIMAPEAIHNLVATFFTVCVCAPLIEELGKYISIKIDAIGEFFVIFNSFEFMNYVVSLVAIGVNPITAILLRIPPMLMHFFTTKIQMSAVEEGEDGAGYVGAVMVHSIWNGLIGYIMTFVNLSF
jgi:hypothetical protein